jgi:two-component system phosphate regulon sensor histidine kinase PhoR
VPLTNLLQEHVFDAIPFGVVVVDEAGVIVRINPAVRDFLPLVPEPMGKLLHLAVPCEPLQRVVAHAIAGGEVVEKVEGVGRYELLLRAKPLGDGEGAVAVIYDITELAGIERARSDFVASVSHELRTPVTSILGYAETLLDHEELDDGMVTMLEAIRRNAGRLTKLFEELMHLYRLEASGGDLPREEMSLRKITNDVVEHCMDQAEREKIDLQLHAARDVVARLNPEAYGHILGNLVNNAIKYTPEGGWVRVSFGRDRSGPWVEVRDNGPGIDPLYRERVFERFFRVDKGRARKDGGTGLGLAIVKHLCRAMHAEVSLQSVPGHGSCFTVRLSD